MLFIPGSIKPLEKKKIEDANTGSAVGSEYLLIKKVRKTPLIILIDSFQHIYTLVFAQLHQVTYIVGLLPSSIIITVDELRGSPCAGGRGSQVLCPWDELCTPSAPQGIKDLAQNSHPCVQPLPDPQSSGSFWRRLLAQTSFHP